MASSYYIEWVILQLDSFHFDTVTKAVSASLFHSYKEIQLPFYVVNALICVRALECHGWLGWAEHFYYGYSNVSS